MAKNQPYINVEEAKKKTKKSDIVLNFDKGQTVYADIYKLQEKISKTSGGESRKTREGRLQTILK